MKYRARYVEVEVAGGAPATGGADSTAGATKVVVRSGEHEFEMPAWVLDAWYVPVLTTTAEIGEGIG